MKIALISLLSLSAMLMIPSAAKAQITPTPNDTNTRITQTGSTFNITGGTQAGANLFHSFQQFGLNQTQIANFPSNPSIQTIIGRVTGGDPSVINGLVQVTGSSANLFLLNPAGIVFGANARLNVGGSFTATTANGIGIGDRWLSATNPNNYATLTGTPDRFGFATASGGSIINAGNLTVGQGQSLTLLGGTVINTGTLSAPGGTITIAAVPGEKLVRLKQDGSLLSLDLPLADKMALTPDTGLTPQSLPALLTGGNIAAATGVSVDTNGVVRLTSSNTVIPTEAGAAIVSNQLTATGRIGGKVAVLGQKVGLVSATVDASGTNDGGTVLIGGDFQGKGTIPNAQQTYVSRDSVIKVDAQQTGNGERAIVWADQATQFFGTISARGGLQSGNGGFVEVSGERNLTFDGVVNVQAATGVAGQLLLDPTNVVIGLNGAQDAQFDHQILADDPGGTFFISANRVVQALSTGNVAIAAGANITIDAAINATANTNTASLTLTAPQINLNNSILLKNGDITLNGNVNSNAPPNTNPFLIGSNSLNTVNGKIIINGALDSSNNTALDLAASETIGITGEIGKTSNLRYVQFRNADTVTLDNYTGANRLDVDFVQQLRLSSPGSMTISNNIFGTVDQLQVNAGNNLTVLGNYLDVRNNLSLGSVNALTLQNADLNNAFVEANLQIQGKSVNIYGSNLGKYHDITIQGQTITVQSTPANPVNITAQGNLILNAQNSLEIQDGTKPVLIQADGNLTAQGNTGVSLQMLTQPQSSLRSGGNLAVISDGTIAANARIIGEGNLAFLTTSGAPGNISIAPVNSTGIISSAGDVTFGNYEGVSLKVEAQGSIRGGNITINGANTTLQGSDPDIAILSSIPSVILRAGLSERPNPSTAYPDSQKLRNTPTVPPDRTTGGTTFTATNNNPSAGTIIVGNISVSEGNSNNTAAFQLGKQVILSATDGVTAGNIASGSQSVAISTARGSIKTGDISTLGFQGYNGVSLAAPTGNIEISTIDTGVIGIDITAGGTLRAIGSKTSGGFDNFGSGLLNNPDLIDYLVSQGFDRQQLLNAPSQQQFDNRAGVRLDPPGTFLPSGTLPPLRVSLISRPSNFISGKPTSPIFIRYGDQSQVILDRTNGIGNPPGRILILGDSQQKFRMGPTPKGNLTFIPADPKNRIQDYNPTTNNFSFAFNASVPLIYPSEQFPVNASGLVAGIVIGPGNNSSLYGSTQFRTFDPVIKPPVFKPKVDDGDGDNLGVPLIDRLTALRQQFQGKDGEIAQRQLRTQSENSTCRASATAAAPSGTGEDGIGDAPEGSGSGSTTTQPECNQSNDDSQILKLLDEAPTPSRNKQLDQSILPESVESSHLSAPGRSAKYLPVSPSR